MVCCSTTREAAALASSSRFIAQTPFFLYKALICAYFLVWCVRWPMQYNDVYLFVTYWSWYIGALYFLASTITALVNLEKGPVTNPTPEESGPSWAGGNDEMTMAEAKKRVSTWEEVLFCAQTFSWNISCVSSLVVASIYWSSLYIGGPLTSVDINAHTFFACIMLIDQFIVATPRRLRDIWITELFAVSYLTFDIIWYIEAPRGQKVIYVILDWARNLDEALVYCLGTLLVMVPIFTLLHYIVFRVREAVYARCQKHVRSPPTVLSNALLGVDGNTDPPSSSRAYEADAPSHMFVDV